MDRWLKKSLMIVLTAAAVLLVGVYGYLYIFELPEIGFVYNQHDGVILSVDSVRVGSLLKTGDQIKRLNGVSYADYSMGSRPSMLRLINNHAFLTLDLVRGERSFSLTLPLEATGGRTRLLRFIEMLPAVIFLGLAIMILLFLRPLDTRWMLSVPINILTAAWLAGLTVQPYNLLGSASLAREVLWLSLPLYLHFSWHFPRPLGRLPYLAAAVIYLGALAMVAAEVLRLLTHEAYLYGLIACLAGVVIIIALHRWAYPELSSDIQLVTLFLSIALLPTIIGALASAQLSTHMTTLLITFSLPAGPLVIIYAIFRRQLGGVELRANKAFTVLQFSMLLMALIVILVALLSPLFTLPGSAPVIAVVLALSMGVVSAIGYPYFARWLQMRLFKLPLLSNQLLHSYAGRITTSLETERVAHILVNEVFPALFVRQAALLYLDEALNPRPVALLGIQATDVPTHAEIPALLRSAGVSSARAGGAESTTAAFHGWARLALALKVEGRPVGLCLLGRRDPDDFYSMIEIPILQSLMDQTALALYNIEQAERLRKMLQANIERNEAERMHLARELHDDVLGQMALVAMNMPEDLDSAQFHQAFQTATDRVRSIVYGLRPTMIAYGLPIALQELADEMPTQLPTPLEIVLKLRESQVRYPEQIELHLYRIIQQACQNAIRHGQASRIDISGTLEENHIDLHIQDNGSGFEIGQTPDLTDLLAHRHFGLAGIFERAALIHAVVRIDTAPGIGTCVSVSWTGADPFN